MDGCWYLYVDECLLMADNDTDSVLMAVDVMDSS